MYIILGQMHNKKKKKKERRKSALYRNSDVDGEWVECCKNGLNEQSAIGICWKSF